MILSPLPLGPAAPCALWRIALDQHVSAAALAQLSADEMARARRFVFERDRARFIAAHAALRQLLAEHTGQAGDRLRFVAGPFGKPSLAAPATLQFNLSHSQDVGLVALSDSDELGVDVEVVRPMPDALALAAAYFSPAELAALTDCPAAERDRAFFVCWTRKEACLKALGIGLHLATGGFEVGVAPVAQDVEIMTPEGIARVHLQSFSSGHDAIGALALRLTPGTPHLSAPATAATTAALELTA